MQVLFWISYLRGCRYPQLIALLNHPTIPATLSTKHLVHKASWCWYAVIRVALSAAILPLPSIQGFCGSYTPAESYHRLGVSKYIHPIGDYNREVICGYPDNVSTSSNRLHNETNCIDLLAISTLQICAPEIYNWIYVNIDKICGSVYTLGMSADEQKKTYNNYLESFKDLYYNPRLMIQVIQTLFPRFSFQTGGYYHSRDSEEELRKKQKIACSTRSFLYFTLSLEDVTISKQELLESINS